MAKNYEKIANELIEKIGGKENIISLTHCLTRLRFKVKDDSKVDAEGLKQTEGVIKLMVAAGQYQVVVGTDVDDICDTISSKIGIKVLNEDGSVREGKKENIGAKFLSLVSDIFMPIIGAFGAVGLVKAILAVLTSFNLMSNASTTYTILNALGDGMFYFLPFFLANSAAKKFNVNPAAAMAVAAALVYPSIVSLSGAADVTLFGIPIKVPSYTSSVLPIIFAVYLQSVLQKYIYPIFPKSLRDMFGGLIVLLLTVVLTFCIVGPVTSLIQNLITSAVNALIAFNPTIAGFIIGTVYPVFIVFGVHMGVIAVAIVNFSTLGYDVILPIMCSTGFAITGATLAIFLKTKNEELKNLAGVATISAASGITEPAIYGACLKYRYPFAIACLMNGVSAAIFMATGTVANAMITGRVIAWPALIAMYGTSGIIAPGVAIIGAFVLTYLFGFKDEMITK